MKGWQYNVAFIVALGMLIFFSVAPYLGLQGTPDPLVVTGFGALAGYVFAHQERNRQVEKDAAKDKERDTP